MKQVPWLVLLSLCVVACSGPKSSQTVSEETPQIELSEAEGFPEQPVEDVAPEQLTEPVTEVVTEVDESKPVGASNDIATNEPLVEESSLENIQKDIPMNNTLGTIKTYVVQKNETLMMIAFKLYGDYGRWKELAAQNQGVLKGSTTLRNGMNLSYEAPAEEFVWNPQGSPYLIRTGDTLGGISKQVYTTEKKWKLLWENNKPLIKDPNKIYAGFTIYYQDGREVASQF